MTVSRQTIGNTLNNITLRYPEKTALIFDSIGVTYRQLKERAYVLAYNLSRLGVAKGGRVAVILSNRIEYVYIYYALFLLGAWIVPISIRYEEGELINVLEDAEVHFIIYEDFSDNFNYHKILSRFSFPLLRARIVVTASEKHEDFIFSTLCTSEVPRAEIEGFVSMKERAVAGDDIALLAYTSGTTGKPKGVMIPHRNFVAISSEINSSWNISEDRSYSVAPLYAAQGFMSLLLQLFSGVTVSWNTSFIPNDVASALRNKNLTGFHTQPTMWSLLMIVPATGHLDLTHLKKCIVSGTVCPAVLGEKIEALTQGTLLNAYGLVEATGIATITKPEDSKDVRLNTVGAALPGVRMKIVNETRQEVGKGEIGELALKGYLMAGYYKKEEETKKVIDENGWLYTGDMAYYYDERNISIVGRCKDMVIRGAFNVYPIEIEECLLGFYRVEDVAVIGKPHDIFGESLVAFVIPKGESTISVGDVLEYCRGKVANYKVPDEVIFVTQLPMLQSGKVQKHVLREWAEKGVPEEYRALFDNEFVL